MGLHRASPRCSAAAISAELLAEAGRLAEKSEAHGVRRWVAEARAELDLA
ncbi:hypothetical protein [Kitasatospora griseola]